MLIISRKENESVLIGDAIEVRILEISSGRVSLGISAPANVLILRKEILLARQQNRAAAVTCDSAALRAVVGRLRERFPTPGKAKEIERNPNSLR